MPANFMAAVLYHVTLVVEMYVLVSVKVQCLEEIFNRQIISTNPDPNFLNMPFHSQLVGALMIMLNYFLIVLFRCLMTSQSAFLASLKHMSTSG